MKWPQQRAREALDGLLVLARIAATSRTDEKVPGVVVELMEALAAESISADGNGPSPAATLDDMGQIVTADEAGAAVGLTGARVRQLCRAGLVHHRLHAGRYAVDLLDLRRHLGADHA